MQVQAHTNRAEFPRQNLDDEPEVGPAAARRNIVPPGMVRPMRAAPKALAPLPTATQLKQVPFLATLGLLLLMVILMSVRRLTVADTD